MTDNKWFDEIEPKIDRESYELAYHQRKNLNIIHTKDDVYLVSKPEYASYVNVNYAKGIYSSKYTFDNFMDMTNKVIDIFMQFIRNICKLFIIIIGSDCHLKPQ